MYLTVWARIDFFHCEEILNAERKAVEDRMLSDKAVAIIVDTQNIEVRWFHFYIWINEVLLHFLWYDVNIDVLGVCVTV